MAQADAFRALTVGARFQKQKFQSQIKLFDSKAEPTTSGVSLLPSLDFLKGDEPKQAKRKRKQREPAAHPESFDDSEVSLFQAGSAVVKKAKKSPQLVAEPSQEQRYREKVNELRNKNKIKVWGSDIPDPIEDFDQLASVYKLPEYLIRNIKNALYERPTPIQIQALPTLLRSRELLACAPTGSGKTMAFLVPIFAHLKEPAEEGFRAIIVSPTRELAKQIHREALKLSAGGKFKVCLLTKATASANNFGPQTSQKFDVLVTTPMRLVHMIEHEDISLAHVERLIFDEADKLFEEKFVEQVDSIIAACTSSNLQISLFSATMLPAVEELARSVQKDPVRIVVGGKNAAAATVTQSLLFVGREEGKIVAMRRLLHEGRLQPPVLVFVQSKERAQQLHRELKSENINADVIHADRTQAQRMATVDKFRVGDVWVLITTDLMCRGMDFKAVNLVINYDFPQSVASYVHRVGRTGRAGRTGEAVTFYTESDLVQLRTIANVMKQSGVKDIPDWVFTLKKPAKSKRKQLEARPVHRAPIDKFSRKSKRKGASAVRMPGGGGARSAGHEGEDGGGDEAE